MIQKFLLALFGLLLTVGCRQSEPQTINTAQQSGGSINEKLTEAEIENSSDSDGVAWEVKTLLGEIETAQREFGKRIQEEMQAGRITSNEGITGFTEAHGPEKKAREDEDAMQLIAANPGDASVFPLIEWLISQPNGDQEAIAWDEVLKNHIENQAVGELIVNSVPFKPSEEFEFRYKTIMKESPHPSVKAKATNAMANHLMTIQRIQGVWDQLNWKETSEPHVAYLKNYQVDNQAIEDLLQTVLDKYSDAFGDDVKDVEFIDRVKATLNEVKHFSVGKTAPEIEGLDFSDNPIKLSDYRGKVVLLVFWHHF